MRTIGILAITCLALSGLNAQSSEEKTASEKDDRILEAIREFNKKRQQEGDTANEVVVVLDPPAVTEIEEELEESTEQVIHVAGKPAPLEDSETPDVDFEEIMETPGESEEIVGAEITPEEDSQPPEASGLAVRVESIQQGSGAGEPSQIKLFAPFAPKPLSNPPANWTLEKSEEAPAFEREIELSSGKSITLTIRPHILAANTDGASSFSISEPGFDAAYGYKQQHTVSAILDRSIIQLDEDAKQLGDAIAKLQQLLASLPRNPTFDSE